MIARKPFLPVRPVPAPFRFRRGTRLSRIAVQIRQVFPQCGPKRQPPFIQRQRMSRRLHRTRQCGVMKLMTLIDKRCCWENAGNAQRANRVPNASIDQLDHLAVGITLAMPPRDFPFTRRWRKSHPVGHAFFGPRMVLLGSRLIPRNRQRHMLGLAALWNAAGSDQTNQ